MGKHLRLQTIAMTIVLSMLSAFTLFAQRHQDCRCNQECLCANGCVCYLNAGHACNCKHNHSHGTAGENIFLQMMDTMMTAMDAVPLGASAEGNFLRQMIPHHQGAIEMAKYEIANGTNREMIQLAKSIFTEQQGEISEMNAMLALYPLKQGEQPSPEYKKAMDDAMMKMMMNTPSDKDLKGKSTDCAFAMVMLPHHQAAVDMATALLKFSPQGEVATYAARIISDQQIEIQQMTEFVKQNCK